MGKVGFCWVSVGFLLRHNVADWLDALNLNEQTPLEKTFSCAHTFATLCPLLC